MIVATLAFGDLPAHIVEACSRVVECNSGYLAIDLSTNPTKAFPSLLQQFCLAHGTLASFDQVDDGMTCLASFFDSRAAASALTSLRAANIVCHLRATPILPPRHRSVSELFSSSTSSSHRSAEASMRTDVGDARDRAVSPARVVTPSMLGLRPTDPQNRIGYRDVALGKDTREFDRTPHSPEMRVKLTDTPQVPRSWSKTFRTA